MCLDSFANFFWANFARRVECCMKNESTMKENGGRESVGHFARSAAGQDPLHLHPRGHHADMQILLLSPLGAPHHSSFLTRVCLFSQHSTSTH